jgi:cobalt-zinc-cadmium efflux system outer membrane protein
MVSTLHKCACLALFFMMTALVGAQPLSPEEAVWKALQTDPRLERDRALAEGAHAYKKGAGSLPNPTLQLSAVTGQAREGANYISQTFEVAGQPGLRHRSAEEGARAADASLEKTRRAVVRETARAYYDYWEAQSVVELYSDQLEFAEQLESIAEERLEIGDISPHEQFRVRQIRTNATIALAEAEGELSMARQRLELLMGESASRVYRSGETIPVAPDFPFLSLADLKRLEEELEHRPELTAARSLAEMDRFEAKLSDRAGAPDLQFTAYRSSLGNIADQGVQVSLVVPLFDWGRLGAEAARKKKVAEARQSEVDVIEREVWLEFKTALAQFEVSRKTRESALELAADYLRFVDVAREGYRIGLLSFVEMFDSQRENLKGFETYLRAEAEFGRAQVELWWASGWPLPDPPSAN